MKKPTDTSSQIDRFIETARKLGCDKSEAAFDEKLKAVVRSKVAEQPPVPSERE